MARLVVAVVAAWSASVSVSVSAGTLSVTVEEVRSDRGDVVALLVDRDQQRVSRQVVAAASGEVRVDFADLPPGDYAVKLFHDEDGDGLMGKNFIGLPTEGYAFSNQARGRFGPPAFGAMRVAVADGVAAATRARMTY